MVTSMNYFQKSRNLLFPLLDIPTDVIPVYNTYLFWKECGGIDDYELIVVYAKTIVANPFFEGFENKYLLNNPNIKGCYELSSGNIAYVFDMYQYIECVECFVNGKYSQYSKECKEKLLTKYGFTTIPKKKVEKDGKTQMTIHIALYPEYYWEEASKELGYENDKYIKNCVELWSVYDKEKETLKESVSSVKCRFEEKYMMV